MYCHKQIQVGHSASHFHCHAKDLQIQTSDINQTGLRKHGFIGALKLKVHSHLDIVKMGSPAVDNCPRDLTAVFCSESVLLRHHFLQFQCCLYVLQTFVVVALQSKQYPHERHECGNVAFQLPEVVGKCPGDLFLTSVVGGQQHFFPIVDLRHPIIINPLSAELR